MKKIITIILLTVFSFLCFGCDINQTPKDTIEIEYDEIVYYTQTGSLKVKSYYENDEVTVKSLNSVVLSLEKINETEYLMTSHGIGDVKILITNKYGYRKEIKIQVKENDEFQAINGFNVTLDANEPYYMGKVYKLNIECLPNHYVNDQYTIIDNPDFILNKETMEIMFKHTGKTILSVYSEQKNIRVNQVFDIQINPDVETYEILFVGNSLTYKHDIPAIIQNMITSDGAYCAYIQDTPGGSKLYEHELKFKANIEKYDFTHIILQENSSGTINGYDLFETAVKDYAKLVEDRDVQLILYQTWAYNVERWNGLTKYEMTQRIVDAYDIVGKMVNAKITRSGEAFKAYELFDNTLPSLYDDMNHQSVYGAYLSACMHYSTLTKRPASSNTFRYEEIELEIQELIQRIADSISFAE